MKVSYSDQEILLDDGPSIFLAGPTPRSQDVPSWRPDALEILRELNFDGTVFVPERGNGESKIDYDDQVEWERAGLSNARAILFWVPRTLDNMPAFTTNVEFGYWLAKSPERIVYGRPPDAPKNRYLDWLYAIESEEKIHEDLRSLLVASVALSKQITFYRTRQFHFDMPDV